MDLTNIRSYGYVKYAMFTIFTCTRAFARAQSRVKLSRDVLGGIATSYMRCDARGNKKRLNTLIRHAKVPSHSFTPC